MFTVTDREERPGDAEANRILREILVVLKFGWADSLETSELRDGVVRVRVFSGVA